jgi:hypothetical protein
LANGPNPGIQSPTNACELCNDELGLHPDRCPACRAYVAGAAATGRPLPYDRRQRDRQEPVPGGTRVSDPPLTTRLCADYLGMTTEWMRAAIDKGVIVPGRMLPVKLEAETLSINGRKVHRIHHDRFVAFCKDIGWARIPALPRSDIA